MLIVNRYGDNNDYKNFKRTIHDASHAGQDKPPLPRAKNWFPEENEDYAAEDSDEDVVIESATTNLKCTFTLQYFKEPYSNNLCPHTFEKYAIVDYINDSGTSFSQSNGQRGEKRASCTIPGCGKVRHLLFISKSCQLIIGRCLRFPTSTMIR